MDLRKGWGGDVYDVCAMDVSRSFKGTFLTFPMYCTYLPTYYLLPVERNSGRLVGCYLHYITLHYIYISDLRAYRKLNLEILL